MKQLLAMFAITLMMVACGEKATKAEETSVEVESVEVDSTTVETNFYGDAVEQVEEVEAEGEMASEE